MTTEEPKASKSGRWRFSLRTLLVGLVFFAVGCTALVNASEAWQTTISTTAFAALFFATLAGLFRRGKAQAFWIGFAVIGWLYLVLVYGLWEENTQPRLATTRALVLVWNAVRYTVAVSGSFAGATRTVPNHEYFLNIGQCLWALLLALLGGLLARYFHSTRADES